jgi:sortase (surface protein transpeptidase)
VEAPAEAVSVSLNLSREDLVPERLKISKIGVDANVQQVGLTAKGNMGVPTNFTDAGWYKYGVAPGEIGSAVMAGHVDNALGLDGVFKHLSDLRPGDEITVSSVSGKELTFKVTRVESYPYDQVPAEGIFNDGSGAHLNLITCDGNWVQPAKNYDRRLVVYSDLVS